MTYSGFHYFDFFKMKWVSELMPSGKPPAPGMTDTVDVHLEHEHEHKVRRINMEALTQRRYEEDEAAWAKRYGVGPGNQIPRIAAVDFDGTLMEYVKYAPVADGRMIHGAGFALEALKAAGYRVIVFSARHPAQIRAWLRKTGLEIWVDDVTREKPPATVIFDDRAIHVKTNTAGALEDAVEAFLKDPWEVPQ